MFQNKHILESLELHFLQYKFVVSENQHEFSIGVLILDFFLVFTNCLSKFDSRPKNSPRIENSKFAFVEQKSLEICKHSSIHLETNEKISIGKKQQKSERVLSASTFLPYFQKPLSFYVQEKIFAESTLSCPG